MKKIIFLLTVSVSCLQIIGLSQTRVGISGGMTAASMKGEGTGDGKGGLITSLVVDAPIGASKFTFHPSLSYVQKGQTEPHPPGTLIDKQFMALRYMELASTFLYNIGEKGVFFLGAGPSIAFNLPSKRVSTIGETKTQTDILFGPTPENDLRGVDWGANFLSGYRTSGGFFLAVNYNLGIRNLATEGDPGTLKNNYVGIQLGVYLNK